MYFKLVINLVSDVVKFKKLNSLNLDLCLLLKGLLDRLNIK